jgi:hypothetical protein
MKKLDTIAIHLIVNGETKIMWVTLGDKKDFTTAKFAIDKVYDDIEERYSK